MNKSAIFLLILLIGIVFISGCIGQTPTTQYVCPDSTIVSDISQCPITYRNEKYGFSIKIPKNWSLVEKEVIGKMINIGKFESPDGGAVIMLGYSYSGVDATTTLEEAIQLLKKGSYDTGSIQSEESKTINDVPVYIVEVLMSEVNLKMKTAYFLPKNSGTLIFAYVGRTDTAYKNYMNELINSINSFQLIE